MEADKLLQTQQLYMFSKVGRSQIVIKIVQHNILYELIVLYLGNGTLRLYIYLTESWPPLRFYDHRDVKTNRDVTFHGSIVTKKTYSVFTLFP